MIELIESIIYMFLCIMMVSCIVVAIKKSKDE